MPKEYWHLTLTCMKIDRMMELKKELQMRALCAALRGSSTRPIDGLYTQEMPMEFKLLAQNPSIHFIHK